MLEESRPESVKEKRLDEVATHNDCSWYSGSPRRPPRPSSATSVNLTDASGTSDRKGTHITKAGPALLRRDLFLAADHFRRNDPHGAKLYHDQMVHHGKHHNSALCIIANRSLIPRILAAPRAASL